MPVLSVTAGAALAVSAFLSFIAMGLTGFGPAIIFHICWQIILTFVPSLRGDRSEGVGDSSLTDAVLMLTVNAVWSVVPLFFMSRHEVRWDVFWWMFVPKTLCYCIGTELLLQVAPARLKFVLGIVFFATAVWRVWIQARNKQPDQLKGVHDAPIGLNLKLGASAAGAMSGLLNGMFGIPGPPLMIYFALGGFDKAVVRGTSTACHFFNLPLRYFYFFVVKKQWRGDMIPQMVILIIFGQLGLQLGNKLYAYSSNQAITWFMLGLLLCSSALMMELPLQTTVMLASCMAIFALWWMRRKRLPKTETQESV